MSTIINATTTNGVVIQPDNSGSLVLQTNSGTTALTIDTSQNVGIGTTSPAYKLDVNGSINISADSFYRIGASTDRYIQYRTGNSDILYSFASGYFYRQDIGNSNHSWFTNNIERMRITSGGEVYIAGTTDQGAYNLQCNGTGVWGAGAYTNGSDARIKDDIQPITSSLEVVNKLNPVTFKYKEDWSKDQSVQTGFIAQELQETLKDEIYIDGLVSTGGEYLSVAYQNIIPLLTKAIQEQQTIINDLKARVETLEAK
jgi:hypothetical protein